MKRKIFFVYIILSLPLLLFAQELTNYKVGRLHNTMLLQLSTSFAGRGLTGDGVRIGVWDGNVAEHIDYGQRVHCCEYELPIADNQAHGMHVVGTICSSGLLDACARGLAPKAQVWTYNFNISSNRKNVASEMLECYQEQKISLSSHSYGYPLKAFCRHPELLTYSYLADPEIDELAYRIPTLTHVFSAGNNQQVCNLTYGTATQFNKNIITVGAVDSVGRIASFSSFGPLRDGRIFPTVVASGVNIYSTLAQQQYGLRSGTSMACPMVTGILALLTQRYQQLNGGALPFNYLLKALLSNTAREAGNLGPDYQYGYGIVDAEAALQPIEEKQYILAEIADTKVQEYKIVVPQGLRSLRVMLCWNDPVAKKYYTLGESPLVNDLDLTLIAPDGTHTLPWTLDPANPTRLASQSHPNTVDPMEQVSLSMPEAGEYTLHIAAKLKQGEKQTYALTWYFECEQPALLSPVGYAIYAPDENILLRTRDLAEPLTVELSYDGGNSYQLLGKYGNFSMLRIPHSAPYTKEALFRITDLRGRVVISDTPFTIMQGVQNLVLEARDCTLDGWRLSWDKVSSATQYEVLQADRTSETYMPLATVNATNYIIPPVSLRETYPIFAVRAISAGGEYSVRTKGILAKKGQSLQILTKDLPYTEYFTRWPLVHSTLSAGQNLSLQTLDAPVQLGFPLRSNVVLWKVKHDATHWAAPFEERANCASLTICELDLSTLKSGTPLQFVVYAISQTVNTTGSTLLRLLVNNEELTNVIGQKHLAGDGNEHTYTWDLTSYAGQRIELKLEAALQTTSDALLLGYYQFRTSDMRRDALVYGLTPITSKANMGEELVRFRIKNNSSSPIAHLPVTIRIDGQVVFAQSFNRMHPFEDREVVFPYNFVSEVSRKFIVEVSVSTPNDVLPENNTRKLEVYNLGNVLRMPKTHVRTLLNQNLVQIPYEQHKVGGTTIFVDNGGALENAPSDDEAVLQLLPSAPNKLLQVTFRYYDLGQLSELALYTGNVPSDLRNLKYAVATEVLSKQSTVPRVFLSEADNGGLVFHFKSQERDVLKGWEAVVEEVQLTNQWQLASLTLQEGSKPTHRKVVAAIRNLAPLAFDNVKLVVTEGNTPTTYTLPRLAPESEIEFEIPKEIDVTPPIRTTILASLPKDGDINDNKARLEIERDRYWECGTIASPYALYIKQIVPLNGAAIFCPTGNRINYSPSTRLTFYARSKNSFELKLSRPASASETAAKVHVWLNLNDNQELEDTSPEYLTLQLKEGKDSYWLDVDLSTLQHLRMGRHTIRFMLATDKNYVLFKQGESIPWGHVFEFSAEIVDDYNPQEKDLAVVALEGIVSGRDLSAESPVSVRIQNNGVHAVEKFRLEYSINGRSTVSESFQQPIEPHGGQTLVTFRQKANLSAVGEHKFVLSLRDIDANMANNTLINTVYHIAPTSEQLFTLHTSGSDQEYLHLEKIGAKIDEQLTIEGWWKLSHPQFANFILTPQLQVAAMAGNTVYPNNTLYIKIGNGETLVSAVPVLKPMKWQHLAVVLSKQTTPQGFTNTLAKVYIDGQEVAMQRQGSDSFHLDELYISRKFSGATSCLRIWNVLRSQQELKECMYTSVRNATGQLKEHCLAEFLFTEGRGATVSSGEEFFLGIASHRSHNVLWQPMYLVENVTINNLSLPTQNDGRGNFVVRIPQTLSDLSKIRLQFATDWPATTVEQAGILHSETREYDFENPSHSLAFVATCTLFGKLVRQECTVTLVRDLSSEAELHKLEFRKAENPQVKNDVEISVASQTIILGNELLDLSQTGESKEFILRFEELAPHARIFEGTKELQLHTPYKVDLSRGHLFRVLSENGRNEKYYSLHLALPQTLTWSTEKLMVPFSKSTTSLDASSSAKLPVAYFSSNPAVVSITSTGQLLPTGVGNATITALQEGNGCYLAATPLVREVEVLPAELTIIPRDIILEEGKKIPPLVFDFQGLLYPNTEYLFAMEYEVVDKKSGVVWDETMPPLPIGEYALRAKGYTSPYQENNYRITRTEGILRIVASERVHNVQIVVKDEQERPINEARVRIELIRTVTDVQGSSQLSLQEGLYHLQVTKEGYTSIDTTFTLASHDLILSVVLKKLKYSLTYRSDSHGVLFGRPLQYLAAGASGESIHAIATADDYRFKQWSDGWKEAIRRDENVQSDIDVTAEFEKKTFTLQYNIAEGGELLPPSLALQTVEYGMDAVSVIVQPLPGYVFRKWSDGNTSPIRTDKNITQDRILTAEFVRPNLLAWSEDFDLGRHSLIHWDFEMLEKVGWQVVSQSAIPNLMTPQGKVAMIDTRGKQTLAMAKLYTPWLSLEGASPAASVRILYTRYSQRGSNSEQKLEYCFEDNVWHQAHILGSEATAQEHFDLDAATLSLHKLLRFRWVFRSTLPDEYLALDGIRVQFIPEPEAQIMLYYFAGEHGALQEVGAQQTYSQIVRKYVATQPAITIMAVPNVGYKFLGWSDGLATAQRSDQHFVAVQALFKERERPLLTVFYTVQEEGSGYIDGCSLQSVREGEYTSSVIARAAPGYRFVKWQDGTKKTLRNDRVQQNATFVAHFTEARLFTIVFDTPEHGRIVVTHNASPLSNGAQISNGEEIQIAAIANNEYTLETLSVNGAPFVNGAMLTVTEDLHIEATFKAKQDKNKPEPPKPSLIEETEGTIVLSPNPFGSLLQIEITDASLGWQYQLLTIQGLVLLQGTLWEKRTALATETLPVGLYLLQLTSSSGQRQSFRIMKE